MTPPSQIDETPAASAEQGRDGSARGEGERGGSSPLARWLFGAVAMGYGTSLILHLILLTLCSVVVVVGTGSDQLSIITGLSSSDDELQQPFDQVIDTAIDLPTSDATIVAVSPVETGMGVESRNVPPQLASNALASVAASNPETEGDATGGDAGHKFKMPSGGNVVRQGNFTAWTVPQDPDPGQIYSIIVQIHLPKRVRSYRTSDLSGEVEGTDRYQQQLPGLQPKYLPVKKNSVQLEILVPGASELVQDTIRIRSKMLNEEQELKIVF